MQTDQAGRAICARSPGATYELVGFETSGDKIAGSLKRAGGKGHFVRDVEAALISGHANLAIHCLKDMPGNETEDGRLAIAGFLPREDPRDVFISTRFGRLEDLPQGALVGTSSPRRAAQLRMVRPDLRFDEEFRGSIDTRIQKVRDGVVDATLLAAAGLNRVGDAEFLDFRLDADRFLPAIGQGTLALQCLADDAAVRRVCEAADDAAARFAAEAERACLRQLDGDCHSAIAGLCAFKGDVWRFTAAVYEMGGPGQVRVSLEARADEDAATFGVRVAQALLEQRAATFLPHRD